MHVHSLKHNAKSAAKRLAAKFPGTEVLEPVAQDGGWVPALRVIDTKPYSGNVPGDLLDLAIVTMKRDTMAAAVEIRAENTSDFWERAVGIDLPTPNNSTPPAGTPEPQPKPTDQLNRVDAALLDQQLAEVKANSKEATMFALLRRPDGATVAEVAAAFDWQLHTARAYISVRVRKRGLVAVTDPTDGRGRVYRVALPEKAEAA